MKKYTYTEEEIGVKKILEVAKAAPVSVVVGNIVVETIDTPHGKMEICKRGIEIEFENELSPLLLTALDTYLSGKKLTRVMTIGVG